MRSLAVPLLLVAACGGPAPRPAVLATLGANELLVNANASDRVQALLLHDKGCLDLGGAKGSFDGKPVAVRNLGGHQGGCAYVGFDVPRPPAHGGPVAVVIDDGTTKVEAVFEDLLAERALRAAGPARPGAEVVVSAEPEPGPVREPVVQGVVGDDTSFLLEGGAVAQEGGRFRFRLPPAAVPGATEVYLRGADVFEARAARCAGVARCRAEVGVSYRGRIEVVAR